VELLNIHDCKYISLDGCFHTMSSIDMDHSNVFLYYASRHICYDYGNGYLNDDIIFFIVMFV